MPFKLTRAPHWTVAAFTLLTGFVLAVCLTGCSEGDRAEKWSEQIETHKVALNAYTMQKCDDGYYRNSCE